MRRRHARRRLRLTRRSSGWSAGLSDTLLSNASGAAALTAFTDDPINLGALGASGALSVVIDLSVTTDQAGAGFFSSFLLGDPPPSANIAAILAGPHALW